MINDGKNPQSARLAGGIPASDALLRLGLGLLPALAAATRAVNGLALGLAVAGVLVCVSLITSIIRGMLPERGRLPVLLVLSATFGTMAQSLLGMYWPALSAELGVYVPLIAVNLMVFAQADGFAANNPPLPALLNGIGMGAGYAFTLTLIGAVRELIGCGSVFGMRVFNAGYEPMLLAVMPAGGLLVCGVLLGLFRALSKRRSDRREGVSA